MRSIVRISPLSPRGSPERPIHLPDEGGPANHLDNSGTHIRSACPDPQGRRRENGRSSARFHIFMIFQGGRGRGREDGRPPQRLLSEATKKDMARSPTPASGDRVPEIPAKERITDAYWRGIRHTYRKPGPLNCIELLENVIKHEVSRRLPILGFSSLVFRAFPGCRLLSTIW